jgi:hypothetical protein
MNERYIKSWTPHLSRDLEMLLPHYLSKICQAFVFFVIPSEVEGPLIPERQRGRQKPEIPRLRSE